MKKLIIKITAATVFTLISFASFAQQATDRKPKIDEPDKNAAQVKTPLPEGPQIVAATKALKAEQPKPIVPGGEFKPTDTNVPVKNYAKTPAPQQASIPVKNLKQPAPQKQQLIYFQ